jgi:DNA-directed RNA polymerase specialized sigma subunit
VIVLSPEQSKLIEDRVGLAKAIGHRAWSNLSGYERDEVISWALKGLVDAAVRWPAYCAEHGFDLYGEIAQSWFNTYATRRINGAIIDTLRQLDLATRRERAIVKDIIGKGVDLYSPWEHESPEAIAAATGIPLADVSAAVSALLRSPLSLEEASEALGAPDPRSVEEEATQALLARRVAAAVAALPPLHQRVLILSVHLGWSDQDVARAVPEISRDPLMSPWKIQWVIFLRQQAQQSLISMLRSELVVDNFHPSGG